MKQFLLLCVFIFYACANESFLHKAKNEFLKADAQGEFALVLPLYTWHNRLLYDDAHISFYNEKPYGLGFAKWINETKTSYALFALFFKDSNYNTQTMFGYIKYYHLKTQTFKISLGYLFGLTQRRDYYYLPLPLPLPSLALSYKKLSLQMTYIPGVKNNGNVLFSWLSYTF